MNNRGGMDSGFVPLCVPRIFRRWKMAECRAEWSFRSDYHQVRGWNFNSGFTVLTAHANSIRPRFVGVVGSKRRCILGICVLTNEGLSRASAEQITARVGFALERIYSTVNIIQLMGTDLVAILIKYRINRFTRCQSENVFFPRDINELVLRPHQSENT